MVKAMAVFRYFDYGHSAECAQGQKWDTPTPCIIVVHPRDKWPANFITTQVGSAEPPEVTAKQVQIWSPTTRTSPSDDRQGPVSLRLMTSQFKDIVTNTQKLKTIKCMFCGVWVQNFVWNFKGALWNFTQNFEPIHRKISILRGVENLTIYHIIELWHLKS